MLWQAKKQPVTGIERQAVEKALNALGYYKEEEKKKTSAGLLLVAALIGAAVLTSGD